MAGEGRVIVALDVGSAGEALGIARGIGGSAFAIKVNWPLILGAGVGIVGELSRTARVICDLKIADIPNTNRLIVEKVVQQGPWGIIAQAFPGRDSLSAVVDAAGGAKVFSVVAMSNEGSAQFIDRHVEEMIKMSRDAGAYGIVAPGNKPGRLASIKSAADGLKIISPGIGAQGGSAGEAVRCGADYVIVGRSVYQSADPPGTLRRINEEIEALRL